MPGNAVLSVGNLWGTPPRPELVGFLWASEHAGGPLDDGSISCRCQRNPESLREAASDCGARCLAGVSRSPGTRLSSVSKLTIASDGGWVIKKFGRIQLRIREKSFGSSPGPVGVKGAAGVVDG